MTSHQYEIALQAYMAYHADVPEIPFDKLEPSQQRRWYRVARAVCATIRPVLQRVPMISTREAWPGTGAMG